jgi:Uma2 family endonuclease
MSATSNLKQDNGSEGLPIMSIGLDDVEKLQAVYPDYRIELRAGKLIVMSPSDSTSGEIGARFIRLLGIWLDDHNIGRVLDASTGFRLPNGDLLSPDVSFVSRERLKQNSRTYLSVIPELIVEIKSSRDRIRELEEKIALFLHQGVQVGMLIDPDTHTVSVYRSSGLRNNTDGEESLPAGTTLRDGETLSIPELFPGWEIPITSLWPPVYE